MGCNTRSPHLRRFCCSSPWPIGRSGAREDKRPILNKKLKPPLKTVHDTGSARFAKRRRSGKPPTFQLSLANFRELADLYSPVRHVGDDLKLSAHGFNDFAQGADIHI
jgi:hypothetical protein